MKKLTIFTYKRDKMGDIKGRNVLRSINVHPSFRGIGEHGITISSEFKKLAKDLEPSMEDFTVVDL